MRHLLPLLALLACSPPEREASDRTPLSADCDGTDRTRCQLPWPSNALSVADPSTETGIRLNLVQEELRNPEDDPACLNRADGFSRVSPVAVGVRDAVDEALLTDDPTASLDPAAPLQVITIQHDHPDYGKRRAYTLRAATAQQGDGLRTLVYGHPGEVLPAAADHAVVLLDTIGGDRSAPRAVKVALGLERPDTDAEAALAENYAPVAAALVDADLELDRILRVSWFTTRSRDDGERRIKALGEAHRAAMDAGDVGIRIDRVQTHPHPSIGLVVNATLTGMPSFLDEDRRIVLDSDGLPLQTGRREVPFRVLLPVTEDGTYRVALYGHGTGGNEDDSSFDRQLADEGIAKINLRFEGWTDSDFINTGFAFSNMLENSDRSTSRLMESVTVGPALLGALEGELADLLASDSLDGVANPAAGARPDLSAPAWVGGSLGGTMGPVAVAAEPALGLAVFNVPGAGWVSIIPDSEFWNLGLAAPVEIKYGVGFDTAHNVLMSQGCWDDVDGAVFGDALQEQGVVALLQESMGDPVLPNPGTELLASAVGAVHLTPGIETIYGLEESDVPVYEGTSLTQFKVPGDDPLDVHGFAARDTIAGRAAFEQMEVFLRGAWEGDGPVMAHPSTCDITADGSCDFSAGWPEE